MLAVLGGIDTPQLQHRLGIKRIGIELSQIMAKGAREGVAYMVA